MNIDKQRAGFEVMESKRKGFASDTLTRATFEPDDEYLLPLVQARWEGYQAALASPEVQALRDALERCRFALEPYDDIKPRDWKSDRENLRRAHQTACAALAVMEKQK